MLGFESPFPSWKPSTTINLSDPLLSTGTKPFGVLVKSRSNCKVSRVCLCPFLFSPFSHHHHILHPSHRLSTSQQQDRLTQIKDSSRKCKVQRFSVTLTLQYAEVKLVKVHKISTQVKKKREGLSENNCLKFQEIESYGKSLKLGKNQCIHLLCFSGLQTQVSKQSSALQKR